MSSSLVSASPSPSSVSAPFPGSVASLAASAGAAFLCVRPSARSFSRWVCVCLFGSAAAAAAFAGSACSAFGFPFCAVRSLGSGFGVSVPCFVSSFSSPVGSLPCLWCSFGGGSAPVPPSPSAPSSPSLPSAVSSVLSSAAAVGFSGSRRLVPGAAAVVAAAVAAVPPSVPFSVGCARGVDSLARSLCPGASVFSVASGRWGVGRGAFAGRSVACVRSVAVPGGVWVSFPSSPCPVGLAPSPSSSRCFSGSGSGSWASLAVALGLGLRCVVWLPAGVSAPVGWGLVSVGGGWWVFSPAAVQLSLF
ncbi:hypothetical protein VB715_18580 [Crocosphaera sp. UHCC 0190]|uniref:hypothetical protein n=1 Tax=Crocosphaera sp. UHCC 0190 TaxID=3110246 RepID=UPI002B1ED7A7|nr:hypothetical protein [Crocosphaera sp. UHCC 0190]MEA5511782.1 hypothetical protein [Crocosphaera sp. UHCC 0190]